MRVLYRSRQNDRLCVMLVLVHIDITPPHTPLAVFRRMGERTIPYSWRAWILKDYSKVKGESSIKEGDLVLIGEANNKIINWPLGKVTKMYKGKDGRVRAMEVKTQFGSVMRPIQKLYPLEVTTVDALPSTERDVEDGPFLDQDQIPVVTFILAVLTTVLDSSTTLNPKGGRMSQTSNQATPSQAIPNQKAPAAPPLEEELI
ncbi:integrase catalytic domain-containing protein [Trichonephila clavipes]|nr:integrase catalytic domain-containing protein [Trichonephila clavipes]